MPLWLHWIALGFVAGAIAKYLMPGRDPSGCVVTTLLGVVGALIGGLIGTRVGWGAVSADRFEPRSLALATIGAVVILLVGRLIRGVFDQSNNRGREQSISRAADGSKGESSSRKST